MTTSPKRSDFSGPFSDELNKLSELIDWLWANHKMSFVKAGDDKVYAYGGNGYILVLDETRWEGLIEFVTPGGAVTMKPDESGRITVSGTTQDEKSIKAILNEGISKLRDYYEKRYWRSPDVS